MSKSSFLVLALLALSSCVLARRKEEKRSGGGGGEGERVPKLFSLFNIVQFQNDPCQSTETITGSPNNRNGTCYSSSECDDKGGSASGTCAAGFGVCCVFIVSETGAAVTQNCTYVQSPGGGAATTAAVAQAYTYTINRISDEVCFLRLDFEVFSLLGTGGSSFANEGECLDTFEVTPSVQQLPVICGENSGEHMYVDFTGQTNPVLTLTLTLANDAANANSQRQWDVKATQVNCGNAGSAPPAGCLQYLTGLTGRITTFNYASINDNHLNNQQYTVCVRPEFGFCCVQYQVCQGDAFGISPILPGDRPNASPGEQDDLCTSGDYVGIPTSAASCNPTGAASAATDSRYCGQFLSTVDSATQNIPICDCTAPFTVEIYTDSFADGLASTGTPLNTQFQNDLQSQGVCLEYSQIPC